MTLSFRGRTADFVFFFLFGMFLLTGAALFVNVIFLGNALNTMFVYVWARRNPYIRMAFFGILNFQVCIYTTFMVFEILKYYLGAIFTICPDIIFIGSWFPNFGGYLGHHVWPYLLLP